MNIITEFFVAGYAFFAGVAILVMATFLSIRGSKERIRILYGILFALGMLLIVVSATPVPMLIFSLSATAMGVLYFFAGFEARETKMLFWGARLVLLAALAYLLMSELEHWRMPKISNSDHSKMYVVGTSLSMAPPGVSYTDLLKSKYGINAFNLSQERNNPQSALKQAEMMSSSDLLILLELGMDDDFSDFSFNLKHLLEAVSGGGRTIMMFELPRSPLSGRFVSTQRELAQQYNVKLIPRHVLAGAIRRSPHYGSLSAEEHRKLADLLGTSLQNNYRTAPE